jgi:hypothetical protein
VVDVDEIDSRGADLDRDLARTRFRDVDLDILKDLRSARLQDLDRHHLSCT